MRRVFDIPGGGPRQVSVTQSLKDRVYYAARDGMGITLYALLQDKTDEEIAALLNQVVCENGQKCTPLIISARNGRERVVNLLVSKFKIDLEQEGTVKLDGYIIDGASALWCAAGAGHLNVVKCLVRGGADVNHATKNNSTPLRAACFDGRLDIVKYLTDHNANIHIANKYNNTCLMIAAYKGHLDVVSFLLEKGADCNEMALCKATALHFAAECGHVTIVKELMEHGAVVTKNEHNMTPLLSAAERTKSEVVEYFFTRPECTREEKIDALDLIGASYANDKDNYNLALAYEFLHRAMVERYSDKDNTLLKPVRPPIPAYENWRECQTVEEIEAIRHNAHFLHMESLVVRERILGSDNPEVPHPVIFRGAVFADSARFDRCIELWLHALRLREKNHQVVVKDLLRFAQVFSQMIHVNVQLPVEYVQEVLAAAVEELDRNKSRIACPGPKDDVDTLKDDIESNLLTVMYLLVIVNKLVKLLTEDDRFHMEKSVYRLNQLCVVTKDGQSPLHLAVSADTPVDDFHTNDVCRFPCSATARLLIQCGADVNAIDNNRNTPLHLIVNYQKPISDFVTLHNIITSLIEAGAHMDTVNNEGETPFEAATTGVAEIILRTQSRLSLKCLAARVVCENNVRFIGHVPKHLEEFVLMHKSGKKSHKSS